MDEEELRLACLRFALDHSVPIGNDRRTEAVAAAEMYYRFVCGEPAAEKPAAGNSPSEPQACNRGGVTAGEQRPLSPHEMEEVQLAFQARFK